MYIMYQIPVPFRFPSTVHTQHVRIPHPTRTHNFPFRRVLEGGRGEKEENIDKIHYIKWSLNPSDVKVSPPCLSMVMMELPTTELINSFLILLIPT